MLRREQSSQISLESGPPIFVSSLGCDPHSSDIDLLVLIGSAKTDPDQFKRVFAEGLLKDKLDIFEAIFSYKVLYLRGEKLLAERPFLQAKRALF